MTRIALTLFTLVFFSITFSTKADEHRGFEIPRSHIVELTDAATKRVYPIIIKVPRSYRFNKNKTYPVIYLTDAFYSFQIASGATRFPMNSGKMQEAILVGISYSKGARGPSSRIRDFTHSHQPSWEYHTGEAENHMQFIKNAVFPYMQSNYRISGTNTFVGNSLGGLFGAYILFTQPELFDHYILGSPSVWFKEDHILSVPVVKPKALTKVYIAVGSLEQPEFGEPQDMVKGAKQLADKVQNQSGQNIELKHHVIPGAEHATAFPTTLIQGLDWIYGKDD